ncbi:MAG: glycosyltransferase, partial [Gemmatimonadales bacterium]|nr:glycosyltransferase [Gemmatimonadales bacterium]
MSTLFVHYGDDWIRGSERVLLDILGGLDRTRFRPLVWCNAAAMEQEVAALGVPVVRADFAHIEPEAPLGAGLAGVRRLVREGRSLVRAHRIGLIHANGGAPTQWMVPVARLEGVPLVAHLHSYYKSHYRHLYLLHEADVVVGCSRYVLEGVAADGVRESRLRVLHNGVSPERLRAFPAASRPAGDGPVLTSLGSLIGRKGHDVTLRALRLLRERGHAPTLLVFGSGPERASLEALAGELGVSDLVTWMGDRPEAPAFLRDATDVLVHAARDEAFGLALLEAGEMGLACVATQVGG